MSNLQVKSHGPLILSTNYWESPLAARGLCYLTLNAGAFRLLIPTPIEKALDDMRTAKMVVVSRGPWPAANQADAIELLFDDESQSPYALHLSSGQVDRMPLDTDAAGEWVCTVWTQPRRDKPHLALQRPARYRRSPGLPDLRPWKDRTGE